MIYRCYSIRDCKSNRFMQPMCDLNDQTASRNFAQAVNNPQGIIGFAPKDFDLYFVGTFDDEKGFFESACPLELIINGAALVMEE